MEAPVKGKGMEEEFQNLLGQAESAVSQALADRQWGLDVRPVGELHYVGNGIARAGPLRGLKSEELVTFSRDGYGLVFDLSRRETGIILLDDIPDLRAGDEMRPTGRVLEVPVGEKLIGRIMDPKGLPLDDRGPVTAEKWVPVEKPAPGIMDRSPVTVPLQTGLKVIDALIPIGRGQRELILGDRQTGKTAVALDTIINQKDRGVVCIYCAIGKRGSAVAKVVDDLKAHQAMDYTFLVFTSEESPPGLQYIAPYAATSMGEYFMEQGRDVLIVYDDLTRHARAYRELSLLLRRPPGREAYPGDIFYIHSRLLERSTHLKEALGGGSLTALPIVETEAQNISAYIPTNLISITDGQVYLSPDLFQKGILPPVDVGKSVSRVGGKTQLPAYRAVAGDLRLSYSQFEELESFARFGTRMDEDTKKTLEHGQRVREILKQPQYQPLSVLEQVAVLVAANQGLLDQLDIGAVSRAETRIREAARRELRDIGDEIVSGGKIGDREIETISRTAREAIEE